MRITFGHLVCLFGCFCGLAGGGIFGEDKLGGMTERDAFKDPLVAEMVEAASSGRLSVVDAKIKAGANVNYVGHRWHHATVVGHSNEPPCSRLLRCAPVA